MRLQEIKIENFKNVKHGKIIIPEKQDGEGASILGLYGQNGTGKTAVIDALTALRELIQGEPIPERFAGYVREGENALFAFTFVAFDEQPKRRFTIQYEIVFREQRVKQEDVFSWENPTGTPSVRCAIVSERLRYSSTQEDGSGIRMHDAAAAAEERGVWPKRFVEILDDRNSCPGFRPEIERESERLESFEADYSQVRKTFDEQGVALDDPVRLASLDPLESAIETCRESIELFKEMDEEFRNTPVVDYLDCHTNGKSYLFQTSISQLLLFLLSADDDFFVVYRKVWKQEIAISGATDEGQSSFNRISIFTLRNPLNVSRMKKLSRSQALLSNQDRQKDKGTSPIVAELQIDPYETNLMDEAEAENIMKTLPYLNIILESIIPGLNVEVSFGEADPDGIVDAQWFAVRRSVNEESYRIPLANESRGVQRIVGWATLLVYVYNEPGFIAVIDEIDAGIFEYLLGEVLNILESEGRGQLIFTSHNLRPLEMLDKSSVVFTTTNPDNRYTRLKNVKPTNNLRDMYFRAITLDTQDETLYDYVSRARLGSAFSRAYLNPIEDHTNSLVDYVVAQGEESDAPLTEDDVELLRSVIESMPSEEGDSHDE